MSRQWFSRMQVRLLLLILVAVLPFLAIIVNSGIEQRADAIAAAEGLALRTAQQIATRQREMVSNIHQLVEGLAQAPEIRELRSASDCSAWLARIATLNDLYADVFVADRDGRTQCRSKSFEGVVDVADRAYFRRALERRDFAIGDFNVSRFTGKPIVVSAHPVFDGHDEITGVVGLAAEPAAFDALLRETYLPEGSVVTILDRRGVILARLPDPDGLAGRTIPELAQFESSLADARPLVMESMWLDQIPRISAIVPVLSTFGDLYARVGIPTAVVQASASAVVRRNLQFFAGAAVLVLAFGWVAARQLVLRRVRDLSETARRLGAGDLNARCSLPADGGELGELARTLNDMAHYIGVSMTKLAAAGQEVRRSNRALRVLNAVTDVVARAVDERQLMEGICRTAVDTGGYRMAWVGLALQDAVKTVRPVAHAGYEAGFLGQIALTWADTEDGQGPSATAIRTGRTCVVRNSATDPRIASQHKEAERRGYASALSIPLDNQDAFGVLTVYASDADAFDVEETSLLEKAAEELVFGIQNLRMRAVGRAAETALELRNCAIDASRNGLAIYRYTPPAGIVSANPALRKLLPTLAEWSIIGLETLSQAGFEPGGAEELCGLLAARREGEVRLKLERGMGDTVWLETSVTLVEREGHGTDHAVLEFRDITERHRYEEQLAHQANHDVLTGLPNRNLLTDRLQQALSQAARAGRTLFVLWLDVDRFQIVDDSFGREAADGALVSIGQRLIAAAEGCSTVARLGGDEFVLIADQFSSEQAVVSLANRLLETLREPLVVGNKELRLTASIGVAESSASTPEVDVALRNANVAMFRAKEIGRDTFCFYDSGMNAHATSRLHLEIELRRAIERGQLALAYQPKVDLLTGEITGVEALCRWRHPESGMVSPAEFIPIAEQSGLILPIGRWVLETACAQMRQWLDLGLDCRSMAVNVSPVQFFRDDLVTEVSGLLSRFRLQPASLMLEITESTLMTDPPRAIGMMRHLKAVGVKLAIDDFGTGYSSLSALKHYPIDYLKVDRAFITDLTTNATDAAIAVSIVSLAHSLNYRVIAEGVETEGQLLYLRGRGCDEMQGYHFSPPVFPEVLSEMLAAGQKLALPEQTDLPERTLLLVDDEPSMQSALRRVLWREGYKLLFASNAPEALDLLARHPVAVVISDFRMPGMDGIQFLDRVRVLYPNTVRLVLSGYSDIKVVTDAINRGAVFRFLHKPWDNRELLESVRAAFARFNIQSPALEQNG